MNRFEKELRALGHLNPDEHILDYDIATADNDLKRMAGDYSSEPVVVGVTEESWLAGLQPHYRHVFKYPWESVVHFETRFTTRFHFFMVNPNDPSMESFIDREFHCPRGGVRPTFADFAEREISRRSSDISNVRRLEKFTEVRKRCVSLKERERAITKEFSRWKLPPVTARATSPDGSIFRGEVRFMNTPQGSWVLVNLTDGQQIRVPFTDLTFSDESWTFARCDYTDIASIEFEAPNSELWAIDCELAKRGLDW